MNDLYDVVDKSLYKIGEESSSIEISPENIASGSLLASFNQVINVLQSGKTKFDNTETGYILGLDNGTAKFYIGNTTSYLNWDGTTLTVAGAVSFSSGTIGGFDVGSDYVRDTANSMGLASTVTGSDDVRFWAGASFDNRATAPFRVTEAGVLVASSATISGYTIQNIGTFGGTGADGALSISSGTTTINLGGAQIYTINYTSISISGTGKLTFSNPHANGTIIIIKSQGAVTLTSTQPAIDASGMGASGGDNTDDGENGNNPTGMLISTDTPRGGASGAVGTGGAAGTALTSTEFYTTSEYKLHRKAVFLVPGAGGASGEKASAAGSGDNSNALGGAGGGALLVECGGALNFTGTVNANGNAGGNGNTDDVDSGGGGGGGAGGMVVILYNTLTSAAGTINTTGGAGGTGGECTAGSGGGTPGGGGGGAGSIDAAGGAGGAADATGSNAGTRAGGGGGGGRNTVGAALAGGAAGASAGGLVIQNKYFA